MIFLVYYLLFCNLLSLSLLEKGETARSAYSTGQTRCVWRRPAQGTTRRGATSTRRPGGCRRWRACAGLGETSPASSRPSGGGGGGELPQIGGGWTRCHFRARVTRGGGGLLLLGLHPPGPPPGPPPPLFLSSPNPSLPCSTVSSLPPSSSSF